MPELQRVLLNLSFYTLLPVAPQAKVKNEDWAYSLRYNSVSGLVFGLLNLGILLAAQSLSTFTWNFPKYLQWQWLENFLLENSFIKAGEIDIVLSFNLLEQPYLLALIIVLANILLSGGLHMDALMDSFDGIACGRQTRSGIVEVMTDSRVGAFGAMAGFIVILLQVVALGHLDFAKNFEWIALLLFVLPMVTRLMLVFLIHFQVDEKDSRSSSKSLKLFKAKKYSTSAKVWSDIIINIVILKLAAFLFLKEYQFYFSQLLFMDFLLIVLMLFAWVSAAWLKCKLKGHNGDSLGASLVLSEAFFYLLIALAC